MIVAIMRRRLPAGQGKRTATFVSWRRFAVMLRAGRVITTAPQDTREIFDAWPLFSHSGCAGTIGALAVARDTCCGKGIGDLNALRRSVQGVDADDRGGTEARIVQGRGNVERDFDAVTPVLLDGFQGRLDDLSEAVAIIYANNFSADDLRGLIAFCKTPLGQRFLQRSATVAQQSVLAGQRFGQSVAAEMRQRIIEELRKKGHDL
jgi:hypothetical protein